MRLESSFGCWIRQDRAQTRANSLVNRLNDRGRLNQLNPTAR